MNCGFIWPSFENEGHTFLVTHIAQDIRQQVTPPTASLLNIDNREYQELYRIGRLRQKR